MDTRLYLKYVVKFNISSIWSNSTGSWMTFVLGYLLLWICEASLEWDMLKCWWCLFSRQKCMIYLICNQHQGRVHILWEKLTSSRTQITMRWKVQNFPLPQCLRHGFFSYFQDIVILAPQISFFLTNVPVWTEEGKKRWGCSRKRHLNFPSSLFRPQLSTKGPDVAY